MAFTGGDTFFSWFLTDRFRMSFYVLGVVRPTALVVVGVSPSLLP